MPHVLRRALTLLLVVVAAVGTVAAGRVLVGAVRADGAGLGRAVLVALAGLLVAAGAGLGAQRLRGAAGLELAAALLLGVGLVVVWL